jgi:DNA-binding winged helix-turn-helix (wHTH) protein
MIYAFDQFELDLATVELRADGKTVNLEPQVFALLALLVENGERLVSKDEIIEKVWEGRDVTDAAVASRVKAARQALGDDGKSPQFIRTVHGQGYRFVAKARCLHTAAVPAIDASSAEPVLAEMGHRLDRMSRPSLAALPFRYVAQMGFRWEAPDERRGRRYAKSYSVVCGNCCCVQQRSFGRGHCRSEIRGSGADLQHLQDDGVDVCHVQEMAPTGIRGCRCCSSQAEREACRQDRSSEARSGGRGAQDGR